MSAPEKIRLSLRGEVLGIVAGGGNIPAQLVSFCAAQSIPYKIVGFKNFTQTIQPDLLIDIGHAGKAITWFQEQGIQDLVMIGDVQRPAMRDLHFHWPTIKIMGAALCHSWGDHNLLQAVRCELERQGFKIQGIHHFLPDLMARSGTYTVSKPTAEQAQDILFGMTKSQALGCHDIGQAVIVKNGRVIAQESRSGTSTLIKNHGTPGSILVKSCKPQQDKDMDLPTIGLKTIELCAAQKMAGVAIHAGASLFVDQEESIAYANQHQIFIHGVTLHD